MSPSLLTASSTFSGLVCVGTLRSLGSCNVMLWVTTGIVIRKMISSTSITSTRGVVLMAAFICSSPSSSGEPTLMPMAYLLPASRTLCTSPLKARMRSITVLLRRISQL